MSTRNIRPGCSRPRSTIFSGGIGSTPASLASTTVSSLVSHQRPGRRPLRSSTAPSTVPSVKVTQAGPSHGSISDAWNSAKPRMAGSIVALFSHASGIIISTACGRVRPPRCSSSSTSSNEAESDAPGVQIGESRHRSPGISVGGQQRLAGAHPVAVAAHGVDLAVVRDEAERVGQRPGREGVGGEPGVHDGDRALHALVA